MLPFFRAADQHLTLTCFSNHNVATTWQEAMHPAAPSASGSTDPRVYLDRLSGSWRYEDDSGQEWEWQPLLQHARPAVDLGETEDDAPAASASVSVSTSSSSHPPSATSSGRWVKVLDEDLVQAQQAAYSVDGVDEHQPAQAVLRRGKKRAPSPSASSAASKTDKRPPSKRPKPITSLYVSGLPLDATADEIARVFSRYGVLLEGDQGQPRIKMYHDNKTGLFRGEALVVYFKPESVELAINMLDQTSMRAAIGQTSGTGPVMRVQRAEFPTAPPTNESSSSAPPETGEPTSHTADPSNSNTNTDIRRDDTHPSPTQSQSSRRHLSDQERKKIAKRVARLETKLSDWRDESDSEPDSNPTSAPSSTSSSADRTVVLTKMFTLFELESDPSLLLDLKQDVRDECNSKIGGVTNVILWDKEPEGIITVRFQTPHQAAACVQMMKGRYFAQRRIDAFTLPTSKPRFKRSTNPDDQDKDQDQHDIDNDHKRIDAFGSWLEQDS